MALEASSPGPGSPRGHWRSDRGVTRPARGPSAGPGRAIRLRHEPRLDYDVSQYGVGAGGLLAPSPPPTAAARRSPARGGGEPGRPKRLRHGTHSSDSVSQYDVGAGGALSPKTPATVATGDLNPVGVAVSPDGRSVYVANFGDLTVIGSVSQYDVGAGGALSPKRPARVAAGYGARGWP